VVFKILPYLSLRNGPIFELWDRLYIESHHYIFSKGIIFKTVILELETENNYLKITLNNFFVQWAGTVLYAVKRLTFRKIVSCNKKLVKA
jgi:hypothetical protein